MTRGWRREDLRDEALQNTGTPVPRSLTTIDLGNRRLVQLPSDDHEVDNWKRQRMYRCRRPQLLACITAEARLREEQFASLRGYILAEASSNRPPGRSTRIISLTARHSSGIAHSEKVHTTMSKTALFAA